MNLTVLGTIPTPAVAVLSTWDPFLAEHETLLRALQSYARRRGLTPVAVMLDPAPPLLIQGASKWAVFHDAETRLRLLDHAGVDAVAFVHFDPDDLQVAAAAFFDVLTPGCQLAEFWLRHGQSIGSGSGGNLLSAWIQGRTRGFHVRSLPVEPKGRDKAALARQYLREGRVRAAAAVIGRAPTLARPASGLGRTAWASGRYHAIDARASTSSNSDTLELTLQPSDDGTAVFAWPNVDARALRILAGPHDLASGAPRPIPVS